MNPQDEVDRLFARLDQLDASPIRRRTRDEQKTVVVILQRLRELYVEHPYAFAKRWGTQ